MGRSMPSRRQEAPDVRHVPGEVAVCCGTFQIEVLISAYAYYA